MSVSLIAPISLIMFVVTIVVGIKKRINLGILATAMAFVLGLFVMVEGGAMAAPELKGAPITSLFPFSIFWMTLSVSLMLNVGSVNGTFDLVIKKVVRLARGRRALIPVYVFLVMFVACSVGAGSTGVMVLLSTIAATIAKDQKIDPVFMLLAVLSGSTVAIGSPVAVIGIICNGLSEQLWGEAIAPSYMYLHGAAMAVLSFAVIYLLFRGWKLESWPVSKAEEAPRLSKKQILTLLGFLVFIVLAMGLNFDMGLIAFLVTAVLLLLGCAEEKQVIADAPWSSILMICGMCMLIGVVQAAGGIDLLTGLMSHMMNRYTVKPLYSILGSVLAMVSSITGVVLPTMIPTIPGIAAQTGADPYALVTSLAFGANITCASPISALGAVALGIMGTNPEWDSNKLFKRMFVYSFVLMGVAAVWAAIGVAG